MESNVDLPEGLQQTLIVLYVAYSNFRTGTLYWDIVVGASEAPDIRPQLVEVLREMSSSETR
jgi:hypothetical protein